MTSLTITSDCQSIAIRGSVSNPAITINVSSILLKKGKITVLMGPSASGKSTLLRNITVTAERPLTVGIVQQGGSDVFPWRTIRQNLEIPFLLDPSLSSNGDPITGRIDQLVDEFQLTESANRQVRARDLSGGEKVRVAVARALVGNPGLVLLDEPCAALDLDLRRKVYTVLKRHLMERQVACLLVSHDYEDVVNNADAIYVLHRSGDSSVLLDDLDGCPLPLLNVGPVDLGALKLLQHLSGGH